MVWLGFYSEIHAVNTRHAIPSIFVGPEFIITDIDSIVL